MPLGPGAKWPDDVEVPADEPDASVTEPEEDAPVEVDDDPELLFDEDEEYEDE